MVSEAVMVFLHGVMMIALENLSTTALMESKLLTSGRSVMKLVETYFHGSLAFSVGWSGAGWDG